MTQYVLSTMTNSVSYAFYSQADAKSVPQERKKILIRGGASVASGVSGFGERSEDAEGRPIWTADGIITPVKDADYEMLKEHAVFKKHLAKGHVRVLNRDLSDNYKEVLKVTRNMEADGFRQLNPSTHKQKIKVATAQMEQESQFRV